MSRWNRVGCCCCMRVQTLEQRGGIGECGSRRGSLGGRDRCGCCWPPAVWLLLLLLLLLPRVRRCAESLHVESGGEGCCCAASALPCLQRRRFGREPGAGSLWSERRLADEDQATSRRRQTRRARRGNEGRGEGRSGQNGNAEKKMPEAKRGGGMRNKPKEAI